MAEGRGEEALISHRFFLNQHPEASPLCLAFPNFFFYAVFLGCPLPPPLSVSHDHRVNHFHMKITTVLWGAMMLLAAAVAQARTLSPAIVNPNNHHAVIITNPGPHRFFRLRKPWD